MNNKIVFSLVVPVYNVEEYLPKCLSSILKQHYDNYEVIIINDGSVDNSEKICINFAKQSSKIKYIKTKNRGLSAARNTGLKYATGEYVWFIDSDDYIEKNSLERLSHFTGADIIVIDLKNLNEKTKKFSKPTKYYNPDKAKQYLLNLPAAPLKILKRSFLQKIHFNFPEGRLFEDLGSMYSLVKYTDAIIFTNLALYIYRQRAGSITHNTLNIKNEDRFWAATQVLKKVPNKYAEEKNFVIIKHIAQYMAYDMAVFEYKLYKRKMQTITKFLSKNIPTKILHNPYIKKEKGLKALFVKLFLFCLENRFFLLCYIITKIRQKKINDRR